MKRYKLVKQDMTTHEGFKWEVGKKYTIDKSGKELCSDQVFHFYDTPEIAVLLNPTHADISNPRLFEVSCDEVAHDGVKGGAKHLTLVKELALPEINTTQKVAFAIYCALETYKDKDFEKWANNWLNGTDRTASACRSIATFPPLMWSVR